MGCANHGDFRIQRDYSKGAYGVGGSTAAGGKTKGKKSERMQDCKMLWVTEKGSVNGFPVEAPPIPDSCFKVKIIEVPQHAPSRKPASG